MSALCYHGADASNQRVGARLNAACAIMFVLAISISTFAQSIRSPLSGFTPPAVAPGSPAGSFALSGFDTINPATRSLNVSLTLRTVQGRGSVSIPLALNLGLQWNIISTPACAQVEPPHGCVAWKFTFAPTSNWWNSGSGISTSYLPGLVKLRLAGDDRYTLIDQTNGYRLGEKNGVTTSAFTATLPDRSEIELRDAPSNGKPDFPSALTGKNRGRIFMSMDGSAASFIPAGDVVDQVALPPGVLDANGWLYTKDGTRMRIESGRPTSIVDRNGNLTTAVYDSYGRTISVTDSNGKATTISYGTGTNCTACDEIQYPGTDGTTHSIIVRHQPLSAPGMLRSGFTVKKHSELFTNPGVSTPNTWGPSTDTDVDPSLPYEVVLPNGRKYTFQYNSHGLVAAITLPTGGKFEYDYIFVVEGTDAPVDGGSYRNFLVKSKVTEKRIFTNAADTTPESTIQFSEPPAIPNSTEVKHVTGSNGAVLQWTRHHLLARSNGPTRTTSAPSWKESREWKTEELDASGSVVRTIEKTWVQREPDSSFNGDTNGGEPVGIDGSRLHDPRVTNEKITWASGNIVSEKTFAYDVYNRVTETKEYDFGTGARGALIRRTPTTFFDDYASLPASPSAAATSHIRTLVSKEEIYDAETGGSLLSKTEYYYDGRTEEPTSQPVDPLSYPSVTGRHSGTEAPSYTRPGNVTKVRLARTGSDFISNSATYDINGGMRSLTDGRGNTTEYAFADNELTTCGSGGGSTYAHVTKVSYPAARPSRTRMSESYCWDYNTGALVGRKDPNGNTETYAYEPSSSGLDRLKSKDFADGGRLEVEYCDNPTDTECKINGIVMPGLSVGTRQKLDGSRWTAAYTVFDGLGRDKESRQLATGPVSNADVVAQRKFDGLGRAYQQSLPFFAGSSIVFSETSFDTLGRSTQVQNLGDNSIVKTTLSPKDVVIEDESRTAGGPQGDKKRIERNALGWVVRVVEDDGGDGASATYYRYDGMGRLKAVCQAGNFDAAGVCTGMGSQSRTFTYDLLGRMLTATNPESGATTYTHDNNGNVETKTVIDQTVITFSYDALNRPIARTYSGVRSAQAVTLCYDGENYSSSGTSGAGTDCVLPATPATNSRVRLTEVRNSVSSTKYVEFDAAGRIKRSQQETTGDAPRDFQYSYNLAGAMDSMSLPSTRLVTYGIDGMGRASSLTWGCWNGNRRKSKTGSGSESNGRPRTVRRKSNESKPRNESNAGNSGCRNGRLMRWTDCCLAMLHAKWNLMFTHVCSRHSAGWMRMVLPQSRSGW
jgi:YD repeat-containing protein